MASVRFQARPQGGVWRNLGGKITLPASPGSNVYSHTVNSESLPNGHCDFRAIAEDRAGNEAISSPVGAEVENRSVSPFSASILGVVAPAQKIHFLGAVANSPEHEAWAYGFSSAPPAEVNGSPLPYTAPGEQLVLLRYTDKSGWQIADVPRGPEKGEPFPLLPADEVSGQVSVSGAMAPSGEAWLSVAEASTKATVKPIVGVFHRAPGGQFVQDPAATKKLGPLIGSEAETPALLKADLRLDESGGQVYGVLTAPGQAEQSGTAATASGSVPVEAKLKYGLLRSGTWELRPRPAGERYARA